MAYRTVGRSRYRKTRSSSFRRAPSQAPLWVRSLVPSGVGQATNFATALIPAVDLDPGARVGSTVLRAHVVCEILGATPTAAVGGFFTGIVVAGEVGVTQQNPSALPYENRNDTSWAHWQYTPLSDPTIGRFSVAATESFTFRIDMKSKRIVRNGENLFFVVQNNGVSGVTGFAIAASVLVRPN